MRPFIIAVPMPAMFIWESFSLLRPFGSITPNILPMKLFPLTFLAGARSAGVPQKVKNRTTFMPMAAAPVAMIIAARCLSSPPESTTIVSLFSAPGSALIFSFRAAISLSTSTLISQTLPFGRSWRPC